MLSAKGRVQGALDRFVFHGCFVLVFLIGVFSSQDPKRFFPLFVGQLDVTYALQHAERSVLLSGKK